MTTGESMATYGSRAAYGSLTACDEGALRAAGVPDAELGGIVAGQADPLLFATVSGAHLYGFPSRDSDIDLRGVHLLPAEALLGLRDPEETRTRMWDTDGLEMDLVTHDLRKFVRLLLRRNGYVLEQLLSPLALHTTDAHGELAALAPGVLTSHHAHHYRGFAHTQWRLFDRTRELKPLLYTFRALLTGVLLMRSGEVQAHLPTLLGELEAAGVSAGSHRREGGGRARGGRQRPRARGRRCGGAAHGPRRGAGALSVAGRPDRARRPARSRRTAPPEGLTPGAPRKGSPPLAPGPAR